jgi:hypothetical protein
MLRGSGQVQVGKWIGVRTQPLTGAGLAALLAATTLSMLTFAAETPQNGSTQMSTASAGDQIATMDTETKSNAFREVLKQMGAGQKPEPKLWSTFVAAQNDGRKTGPKIGDKIPDFSLPDQNGKSLSLHELMGPEGLLLVFSRSADW